MDIQAPLVVIGAGRSGSTLLSKIFNAHPLVDFKGETSFLLSRLWLELWNDQFWLNWPRQMVLNPSTARAPLPPWDEETYRIECQRVGRLLSGFFVELLGVNSQEHQVWGYKELWNGQSTYHYDWEPHNLVLPRATWVHLIRHPFEFAKSCANWNEESWTLSYLTGRLHEWVKLLKHNRLQTTSERYFEIRYEDFTKNPQEILRPIFQSLGISWHGELARVLDQRVMRSSQIMEEKACGTIVIEGEKVDEMVAKVEGLREEMIALQYEIPKSLTLRDKSSWEAESRAGIDVLRTPKPWASGKHWPRYVLEEKLNKLESRVQSTETLLCNLMATPEYQIAKELTTHGRLLRLMEWWLGSQQKKSSESKKS